MKYAKIQNGVVVNIQLINQGDILDPQFTWVDIDGVTAIDGSWVSIGYTYDGNNFTAPPSQPPPPPVVVSPEDTPYPIDFSQTQGPPGSIPVNDGQGNLTWELASQILTVTPQGQPK